jgi:hypothetical protein
MYDTLEEHAFTDVVLSLFNTILGHHTNSAQFWTFGIRALIEAAFGVGALEDIPVGTSLRDRLDVYSLFKRIQQLTGVKLTGQAMRELKENPDSFYLVSPDIEKVRLNCLRKCYRLENVADIGDGGCRCPFESST